MVDDICKSGQQLNNLQKADGHEKNLISIKFCMVNLQKFLPKSRNDGQLAHSHEHVAHGQEQAQFPKRLIYTQKSY